MIITVIRHEKIGLMCKQNLNTFYNLKFFNFMIKYSITMKLLELVQKTMSYIFKAFTELVYIAFTEGKISRM